MFQVVEGGKGVLPADRYAVYNINHKSILTRLGPVGMGVNCLRGRTLSLALARGAFVLLNPSLYEILSKRYKF